MVEDFNPRTRVECDCKMEYKTIDDNDFNPRTRVECDSDFLQKTT